jgi:uncharacterized protein involved in type VI secretion and phage assembly
MEVACTFRLGGGGPVWRVLELAGTEGISRPYRFELILEGPEPDLDPGMERTGTLLLGEEGSGFRRHGVLAEVEAVAPQGTLEPWEVLTSGGAMERSGEAPGEGGTAGRAGVPPRWRVVLVPRLARLQAGRDSDLFLGLSVPELLQQVLEEAGFDPLYVRRARGGTHPRLEAACRYRESPFAFLSRHLEAAGLSYHFEHPEGGERLVLQDAEGPRDALPPGGSLALAPRRRARTWIGEDEPEEVASGRSGRPDLLPGLALEAGDRSWLVLEVRHEGRADPGTGRMAYGNTVLAQPLGTPFRPPRTAPTPLVAGTLAARVVTTLAGGGPDLDERGRPLVAYPFGRHRPDAPPGLRVPMAQAAGGEGQGCHFPLPPGTEVLLAFQEGDPDRPVVAAVLAGLPPLDPSATGLLQGPGGSRVLFREGQGQGGIQVSSPAGRSGYALQAGEDDRSGSALDWAFGRALSFVEGNRTIATVGDMQILLAGSFLQAQVGLSTNLFAGYSTDLRLAGHTNLGSTDTLDFQAGSGLSLARTSGLTALDNLKLSAGVDPNVGAVFLPWIRSAFTTLALVQAAATLAQGAEAEAWLRKADDEPGSSRFQECFLPATLATTAGLMGAVALVRAFIRDRCRSIAAGGAGAEVLMDRSGLTLRNGAPTLALLPDPNAPGLPEGRIELRDGKVELIRALPGQGAAPVETRLAAVTLQEQRVTVVAAGGFHVESDGDSRFQVEGDTLRFGTVQFPRRLSLSHGGNGNQVRTALLSDPSMDVGCLRGDLALLGPTVGLKADHDLTLTSALGTIRLNGHKGVRLGAGDDRTLITLSLFGYLTLG